MQVMASELSARLKQAIDASNVRHFEDDVQERLALRKAPGGGAAVTVADVLQVTYTVTGPLASLMPERVMMRYEQVSTFLLKLKTMEFQLQQAWQVRRGPERPRTTVFASLVDSVCWAFGVVLLAVSPASVIHVASLGSPVAPYFTLDSERSGETRAVGRRAVGRCMLLAVATTRAALLACTWCQACVRIHGMIRSGAFPRVPGCYGAHSTPACVPALSV